MRAMSAAAGSGSPPAAPLGSPQAAPPPPSPPLGGRERRNQWARAHGAPVHSAPGAQLTAFVMDCWWSLLCRPGFSLFMRAAGRGVLSAGSRRCADCCHDQLPRVVRFMMSCQRRATTTLSDWMWIQCSAYTWDGLDSFLCLA